MGGKKCADRDQWKRRANVMLRCDCYYLLLLVGRRANLWQPRDKVDVVAY